MRTRIEMITLDWEHLQRPSTARPAYHPKISCLLEFPMRRLPMYCFSGLILSLVPVSLPWASAQDEAAEAVAEAVATESDQQSKPKIRPLTVATGVVDKTVITGTLIDSTSIAMKTAFGEASIPLSEVAGIRFPAIEDTSTTIVMLNGDSITGATDLKFVNVETTWGSAKINGQNIASMLFVPGLTWQSVDGLGGKRWNLIEVAAQQKASAVQPAGGTGRARASAPRSGTPQVIFGR